MIAPDLPGYGSSSKPQMPVAMRPVGFEGEGTIPSIVFNMVAEPEELDTAVQLEGYYQPWSVTASQTISKSVRDSLS